MSKILYTTHNDLSLPYFRDWRISYYDNPDPEFFPDAKLVYFRDPFNDPAYQPDAGHIDQLFSHYKDIQIVDNVTSFDDILHLEDKYLQYQTYSEWSPRTWLPSQHAFIAGQTLAKPRISQRAKDILFSLDGRQLNDSWIIQELLDIQEELRVYAVYGKILPIASIKSSKSSGVVKIIGTRPLTEAEMDFVQQIMIKCPLDVVGFDIAVLPDGQLKVIEANRSPQFKRYAERTDINLADYIK